MSGLTDRGLVIATIAVVGWGAIIVASRLAVTTLELNPMLFTLMNFIWAGLGLMVIGGRRNYRAQMKRMLGSMHTWVYGILRVPHLIVFNTALIALTATEAEFIARIAVPFIVLIMWISMARRPFVSDWVGMGVSMFGIGWLISMQDGGLLNWAVWLILLSALLNASLALIGEVHPESNKALGMKVRSRYTGVVLLVTAICYLVFMLILTMLQQLELFQSLQQVFVPPSFMAYGQLELHLASLVTGLLLYAPTMYFTFLAFRLVKADNTLMIGTLIPFATLAFESVLSLPNWVNIDAFVPMDMLAGLVIATGALLTVFLRWARHTRMKEEFDELEYYD